MADNFRTDKEVMTYPCTDAPKRNDVLQNYLTEQQRQLALQPYNLYCLLQACKRPTMVVLAGNPSSGEEEIGRLLGSPARLPIPR